MATISYDGQSLIVDGQRIWLISGTIDYARTPRGLWRDRIRAAKQAGLNCIMTTAVWNLHEIQPGAFDFEDDLDIGRFIEIVGEEGMYCVLRAGPYVGNGYDMGGIPAWLHDNEEIQFRQSSPIYLQSCARYIDALIKRVQKHLVTNSDHPGPIVMVQNEQEWLCHNEDEGAKYLDEITRFLRESGVNVPIINTNNLWQEATDTIDTWVGWDSLFVNSRQIHLAQPDAPRFITELRCGGVDYWNFEHDQFKSPDDLMRRMARISAGGAQFNLHMFHGGTNFGFNGGRQIGDEDRFITTSHDCDAPVSEVGFRTKKYDTTKRIAMFLNQFGNVMTHLDSDDHHTVAHTRLSVIQQSGSQGDAVFIVRNDDDAPTETMVITPDGQKLYVNLGDESAAWILLNTNLNGTAILDLTSLRPWAFLGRQMLVLYGPEGSDGLLSIDQSLINVQVPTGNTPTVFEHENISIVICNTKQIDAAYVKDNELYVGVGGFDRQDEPMPHDEFGTYHIITHEGEVTKKRHKGAVKPPSKPRISGWECAGVEKYIDGTAPRYATLDGPRSLEKCRADFGYGWYRIKIKNSKSKKANAYLPHAGDRVHMYEGGKLKEILGLGPNASLEPFSYSMKSGETDLVFLADNLGRADRGLMLGREHGIYGHLMNVSPMKLPKVETSLEPRVNPFELTGYVPYTRFGDRSQYWRYTYTVTLTKKSILHLELHDFRPRSVLIVNDEPVAVDEADGTYLRVTLKDDVLKRGKNRITLALFDEAPEDFDPSNHVKLYEVKDELTEKAKWWYARWEMPRTKDFGELPEKLPSQPMFFRTTFKTKNHDYPLMLDISGMTKGQIFLNGHNVGRYFVGTTKGEKIGPQRQYYLPEPWLNLDCENELVIFDEHGKSPAKTKLVYITEGPFKDWD